MNQFVFNCLDEFINDWDFFSKGAPGIDSLTTEEIKSEDFCKRELWKMA